MGLFKRIWIDRDPAYAEVRQKCSEEAWTYASQFTFRAVLKRRNRVTSDPYWDPVWRNAPYKAARQLNVEYVTKNDGIFFRTDEDRRSVMELAESLWLSEIERRHGEGVRTRLEPLSFR